MPDVNSLRGRASRNGDVSPKTTGIYFRLIWGSGLPEAELKRYARRFNELAITNPERAKYPEWLLQEVDAAWLTEVPSPSESGLYVTCTIYVDYLLGNLGDGTGDYLDLSGGVLGFVHARVPHDAPR